MATRYNLTNRYTAWDQNSPTNSSTISSKIYRFGNALSGTYTHKTTLLDVPVPSKYLTREFAVISQNSPTNSSTVSSKVYRFGNAANGIYQIRKYILFGSGAPSIETLSDSISLSDSIVIVLSSTIITLILSDSFSLSDSIVIFTGLKLTKHLVDSILLSDALAALLADNPTYVDQLTLSDLAQIQLSLGFTFNDTLNLLDSLQIQLSNNLSLTNSDTLSLSDSLSVSLSGNLDFYIRHYLNDVPN